MLNNLCRCWSLCEIALGLRTVQGRLVHIFDHFYDFWFHQTLEIICEPALECSVTQYVEQATMRMRLSVCRTVASFTNMV